MNKAQQPGIVFMGTPGFAVASLKAITEAGYEVKGVITAPDRPAGRGLKLQGSPVKIFAQELSLPLLQPTNLKDPDFLNELKKWDAGLQVVVAFRMLPEEVWKIPKYGTFNLHASLLPQYRGAAPINWAIINGEQKTGVTTFFINHAIDEGKIIFKDSLEIGDHETAGELHDRLMEKGASLVIKTIDAIVSGAVDPLDQKNFQTEGPLRNAPKIRRDDCKISWNNKAVTIFNLIRGMSPYPCAWSELKTPGGDILTVKIYFATPDIEQHHYQPGSIVSDKKEFLKVAVNDGYINLKRLQLQGKKQLHITDFLRGFSEIDKCTFE